MNNQPPIYPGQVPNEVPIAQPAPYGAPQMAPPAQMCQPEVMDPYQNQACYEVIPIQQQPGAYATATVTPMPMNPHGQNVVVNTNNQDIDVARRLCYQQRSSINLKCPFCHVSFILIIRFRNLGLLRSGALVALSYGYDA